MRCASAARPGTQKSLRHFDLKPGGKWRIGLKASPAVTDHRAGATLWQGGVYREVDPPRKLVWTSRWDLQPWEKDGNNPETMITVTFTPKGGRTLMVFRQEVFETKANRDGHVGGWNSSFDRLGEYLAAIA